MKRISESFSKLISLGKIKIFLNLFFYISTQIIKLKIVPVIIVKYLINLWKIGLV